MMYVLTFIGGAWFGASLLIILALCKAVKKESEWDETGTGEGDS